MNGYKMFRCVISHGNIDVMVVSTKVMPSFDTLKTCNITQPI
jgi:hypothetical protein